VVQQAYVNTFGSLGSFRSGTSLLAWVAQQAQRGIGTTAMTVADGPPGVLDADLQTTSKVIPCPLRSEPPDPERAVVESQIRHLIERAIDELPEIFRVVFGMHAVKGMSIDESANFLGLPPATVTARMHRARRRLHRALDDKSASCLTEAFPFHCKRCQQMTDKVLEQLLLLRSPRS
jgi:RNA polymerase sigma-70 factor (ECF subfamily)